MATVSGFNPSSTVDFAVYTTNSCTGTPVFTSDNRETTGGVATSETFTSKDTGTYYWRAHYDGDINNQESYSVCGANHEIQTVNYIFNGFFAPILNTDINIENTKKTSGLPVKWYLADGNGPVSNPLSFAGVWTYLVDCNTFERKQLTDQQESFTGNFWSSGFRKW